MPRVSIIMPAFNAAGTLPEALDSVLRQTFDDWELIVVDDGSTDHTRGLIEARLADFNGRLQYVAQQNGGVASARNTGIKKSTGEFISLLDADDVWLPHRLERGILALDADLSVGLVHGRVLRIDAGSKVIEAPHVPAVSYLSGKIAHHLYTRRAHVLSPTVLFRRSCLSLSGLFDETLRNCEDRDLWFRIGRFYPIAYLDEVLAHYRISPRSLSRDWLRGRMAQLKFLKKHRLTGAVGIRAYTQGLANLDRERGDMLFNQGRLGASLRWYSKAVVYDPLNPANLYMLIRALADPAVSRMRNVTRSVGGTVEKV